MTVYYGVLEYNQAGGGPRLYSDDVYDDKDDAVNLLEYARAETAKTGRRERYRICEITPIDDEDD